MERNYNFVISQKVKMFDLDNGGIIFGEVTDKSRDSVFIKWDNNSESVEYFENQYQYIKLK